MLVIIGGDGAPYWKTPFSVLGGRNRSCMRCFLSQGRKVEVSWISASLVRQLPLIFSAYSNRCPGPKMLLSRLNGDVSTHLWHRNVVTCGKVPYRNFSVSFKECRLSFTLSKGRYRLIRPTRFWQDFSFPVTGKVIYAFLYYYVTDNRRYI